MTESHAITTTKTMIDLDLLLSTIAGAAAGGTTAVLIHTAALTPTPKPARPQRRSPMERELSYLPSERFDIGDELYASLPNHAFPHWYVSIQGFGYDVVYVLFHSIVRKPDGASCAPRHVETQTTAAWLPLSRHWDGTAPPPIHVPKHVLDCVTKQLIGVLPPT